MKDFRQVSTQKLLGDGHSGERSEAVDKDLVFMALTLASFAVALISINTALLG